MRLCHTEGKIKKWRTISLFYVILHTVTVSLLVSFRPLAWFRKISRRASARNLLSRFTISESWQL